MEPLAAKGAPLTLTSVWLESGHNSEGDGHHSYTAQLNSVTAAPVSMRKEHVEPNTEAEACKVFAALTGEIGTIPGNWVIWLSPSEV